MSKRPSAQGAALAAPAPSAHRGAGRAMAHDALVVLRHAAPVLIAGFAAFCALVPGSTSLVHDVSVLNVNYTHDQLKYQLYAQGLGGFVNAASVLFGAALAIALFRFLLEKRSTTAFFSVGLSRAALFGVRAAVALACLVAGIAIPFFASFLINAASLGVYDGFVQEFAFVTCGYLLTAFAAFAISAIAMAAAGTLFEGVLFSAVLLCGMTALLWGAGAIASHLLVGNAAGAHLYGQEAEVAPSLLVQFSLINPISFFAEQGSSHQFFMAQATDLAVEPGDWTLLAGWLVASLAIGALALAAFCRRRGEQAEMAGGSLAFSLLAIAVAGAAAFSAALELLGDVDVRVALVVGFAAFLLVSCVLILGPLRGRATRGAAAACIGGEFAVMAACVAVAATGGLGFSSYVPAAQDVQDVEVSYNGSPSYLVQGFSGTSGDGPYYYTSYRSYGQESSVDIVRSLHAQLVEAASLPRMTDYEDFQSSVVPYDVVIRYRMKDGSECVRYFDQARIGELSAMLALDNDEHTHELETAVVTGDSTGLSEKEAAALADSPSYAAYRSGAIYLADGALNKIVAVECSDQERAALLEALAADLARLNANERYAPSGPARAALMFTMAPELDVATFGYSFNNAVSYITDEWTQTMAWLESKGLLDAIGGEISADVIEKLTLQVDDPYASINAVTSPTSRYFMGYRSEVSGKFWVTQDYGAKNTVTDPDQIAQMLPNLRLGCYMTGGYLVEAKLRGIEAYVYFYLPAELAPDYV